MPRCCLPPRYFMKGRRECQGKAWILDGKKAEKFNCFASLPTRKEGISFNDITIPQQALLPTQFNMANSSSSSSSRKSSPPKFRRKRSASHKDDTDDEVSEMEEEKEEEEILKEAFRGVVNQLKFLDERYDEEKGDGSKITYELPPAYTQVIVYEEDPEANQINPFYKVVVKHLDEVLANDKLLTASQIIQMKELLIKTQPVAVMKDFHTLFNFFTNMKGLPATTTFFDTIMNQFGRTVVQSIYFADTTNEYAAAFKGVSEEMKLQRTALYAKAIKDYKEERERRSQEKLDLMEERKERLERKKKKAYVENNATGENDLTDDE